MRLFTNNVNETPHIDNSLIMTYMWQLILIIQFLVHFKPFSSDSFRIHFPFQFSLASPPSRFQFRVLATPPLEY